jgi:hypothetical protein
MLWNKINDMRKKIKFENNIRLQHLVFEYNIFHKEYFHINNYLQFTNLIMYQKKRQTKLMFICYLKMNFKEI